MPYYQKLHIKTKGAVGTGTVGLGALQLMLMQGLNMRLFYFRLGIRDITGFGFSRQLNNQEEKRKRRRSQRAVWSDATTR
jgi:hypothetical protein